MVDYKNIGKRDNIFKRAWQMIVDNQIEIYCGIIFIATVLFGILIWVEGLPDPIK